MEKKKITYSLVCAGALLLGGAFYSPSPSLAAGSVEKAEENPLMSGTVDLKNLDESDENVTVEKITYDQYVKEIAENQGISEQEVRENSQDLTKPRNVRTTLDTQMGTSDFQIQAYEMHRIAITQNVKTLYKPKVQIYAYTYSYGSAREYKYIENIDLDRSYGGISKQFNGTVKGKITTPTKIWWMVNGDFFNNGKTTWSVSGAGKGAIKGKEVTLTATVSGESNLYKYWNNYGTHSAY
ncbi:hypothetical protein [Rossellomorea marisflavi]|uniref:hypothetical protein n=1 Tax=Rossellomorea marisflavi TaxID=189381 RepID=UPI0034586CA4